MNLCAVMDSAKRVEKTWGAEFWVTNDDKYCFKVLVLKANHQCSLHRHLIKQETFIVVEGVVRLQVGTGSDFVYYMKPGDQFCLPPDTWHRFSSNGGAIIFEISTHHSDDDVERLTESGECK